MRAATTVQTVLAMWRVSLLTALQYRGDFFLALLTGLAWAVWSILPLLFVFRHTDAIEGWSYPAALLVMSFFICLRALLDGFIEPNLRALVARVQDGSLDFVLIKPADSQVLVSFARFVPARLFDLFGSLVLAGWCLDRLGHIPSPGQILAALLCLLAGVAVLYSLWLMSAATTFFFVRVESLSYLLGALLDAGRWPAAVYRGWVRAVLTFVLPVTLMTTFPARALLGELDGASALWAAGAAVLFTGVARFVWLSALSRYTSASS
jgi:ABC-2 type transport system permease protein